MNQTFAGMLAEDGKKNSLGRVNEVIEITLNNRQRIDELYETILHNDAWVRMRAIDAFEKICRLHPDWVEPYIDRIQAELSISNQASIQWHIAQIYSEIELNVSQRERAIIWLKSVLSTKDVDWIVAANSMDTLAKFVRNNEANQSDLLTILDIQKHHKSNAVLKRVNQLASEFF